jgi:ribonuclease J
LNEIGGNKFLIQDKDVRIFLDFGKSFSEESRYFSEGLIEPRRINGAGDLFEFGILPEILGLYSEEALQNTSLKYTKPDIDGIFLSHYHSDHFGRIEHIDENVPIYCGETTKILGNAAADSSSSSAPLKNRTLRIFRTGEKIRIGSIEVVPIHVDHSIPGAYGFLVHTSEDAIVYTGDLRFHGPQGKMTYDFVSQAFRSKPLLLLTEGTRVGEEKDARASTTERDVVKEIDNLMKENKKNLFVASFRANDVDRINSCNIACKENGRTLMVSIRTAHMLKKLEQDAHLSVPKVGTDAWPYIPRKKSGKYDDKDYYVWEREFLNLGITCHEVRRRQSELLLHLGEWYFPELVDINPEPGGVYIHSSSEPFNEEEALGEEIIKNWTSHFGMSYHQIHASGHASMAEIGHLIDDVAPAGILPIHTNANNDVFSKISRSKVIHAKISEPIQLDKSLR